MDICLDCLQKQKPWVSKDMVIRYAGLSRCDECGEDKQLVYVYTDNDEKLLVKNDMEIVIQVLGRKRATLTVPTDITQDALLERAKAEPHVAEFLGGKAIVKVIYVPGRLMNIVVK